jgi:hypothetical protein
LSIVLSKIVEALRPSPPSQGNNNKSSLQIFVDLFFQSRIWRFKVCPQNHVFFTEKTSDSALQILLKKGLGDQCVSFKTLSEALAGTMCGDPVRNLQCEVCGSEGAPGKSVFVKLPNTLVFRLERFDWNKNGEKVKNSRQMFTFPVDEVWIQFVVVFKKFF